MGNSTIQGSTPPPVPHSIDKSYGQGKSLGGLSGGPTDINMDGAVDEMEQYAYELKRWLVDVMESGQQVSDADWNQVMQYVQYTSQALGGGWDPFAELGLNPPAGAALGQGGTFPTGPNPNEAQGGFVGVLDNYVYNKGDTHIEFIGSEVPHDIYTDDFTLDVPYESAQVTVELTEDTRIQPPEDVLKITVTDPMVGATTVYYVHNYTEEDKNIKINTADGLDDVEFLGDTADLVDVGEYTEISASAEPQTTGHEMVPDPTVEDRYSVTAAGPDDVIELTPKPNGPAADGEQPINEDFLVNGNSIITVPMDAQSVVVSENGSGLPPGFPYTVVVTHADGSTDTFYVKGGSLSNHINALPEMITFGTTPMMNADGEIQEIPDAFADHFTIYESAATQSAGRSGPAGTMMDALMNESGLDEEEILEALDKWGYDFDSFEEFADAVEDGEFPKPPYKDLLCFILEISEPLQAEFEKGSFDEEAISGYLKAYLEILYPDEDIDIVENSYAHGTIAIGNEEVEWWSQHPKSYYDINHFNVAGEEDIYHAYQPD